MMLCVALSKDPRLPKFTPSARFLPQVPEMELMFFKQKLVSAFDENYKLIRKHQEIFQSNYISNIVSQNTGVNFRICEENLTMIKVYARSVDYNSRNIDQLLLLESEIVPYNLIKDLIPVDAIFEFFGTRKSIFAKLYWAVVCICRRPVSSCRKLIEEATSIKQLYKTFTVRPYLIFYMLSPQVIVSMGNYLNLCC